MRHMPLPLITMLRILLPCLTAAALISGAVAQENDPLLGMLEKSGLKFEKLGDEGWIVPFEGKDGKTIDVFVAYNDDEHKFALVFTTVVNREADFEFNRDVLRECMRLNNEYSGCKFCLDDDEGDLDCQSEPLMETLTPEALSLYINAVASIADEHGAKLNQLAGGTPEG